MATSFFGLNVEPIMLVRGLATTVGVLQVLIGARGIMVPTSAAVDFGFAQSGPVATTAETNPFIPATGGRNLAAGLALVGCVYFGCEKAIGVIWSVGIVTGLVDGLTVLRMAGDPDKNKIGTDRGEELKRVKAAQAAAYGHIGIPVVFSAIGLWMIANL